MHHFQLVRSIFAGLSKNHGLERLQKPFQYLMLKLTIKMIGTALFDFFSTVPCKEDVSVSRSVSLTPDNAIFFMDDAKSAE